MCAQEQNVRGYVEKLAFPSRSVRMLVPGTCQRCRAVIAPPAPANHASLQRGSAVLNKGLTQVSKLRHEWSGVKRRGTAGAGPGAPSLRWGSRSLLRNDSIPSSITLHLSTELRSTCNIGRSNNPFCKVLLPVTVREPTSLAIRLYAGKEQQTPTSG